MSTTWMNRVVKGSYPWLKRLLADQSGSGDVTTYVLLTAAGAAMVALTVPSLFSSSQSAAKTFQNQVNVLERGAGGAGSSGGSSGSSGGGSGWTLNVSAGGVTASSNGSSVSVSTSAGGGGASAGGGGGTPAAKGATPVTAGQTSITQAADQALIQAVTP